MISDRNESPLARRLVAIGHSVIGHWSFQWLLLAALTLLAYWPALRGGLLWDDDGHLTRPDLRSLAGLARIWTDPTATQQYYPLLHSAFWLEFHLWGEATFGYHLVNVLLHATSACLFAAGLRRLGVRGAWIAAAIFALHPVQVETVAWISEQKNTLSGVFYLAAAYVYLRFDDSRRPRLYVIALCLFLCALLSKSVTATLPAALLVIFWWRRGRLDWRRDVAPLLPWLVLGCVSGFFTAWLERTFIGAHGSAFQFTPIERVLIAGRAFWFYLGKLVWPSPLIFIYPRWSINGSDAAAYLWPLAVLALFAVAFLCRRQDRAPLATLLFFAGTLFPALGFFNVYPFVFSFVADHFQYLASLGPIALVSALMIRGTLKLRFPLSGVVFILLLTVLALLTWQQAHDYIDSETLYTVTLRRNPGCWMAHYNLANQLQSTGRATEAIDHYRDAIALNPDFADAYENLGAALNHLDRHEEAIAEYEHALALRPNSVVAHYNLGGALAALQRWPEAVAQFRQTQILDPHHPGLADQLGGALAHAGDWAEALPELEAAVREAPDDDGIRVNLGIVYQKNHRSADAIRAFNTVLQRQPDFAAAHFNLALSLIAVARTDEAKAHYRRAREINPRLPTIPALE